MVFDSILGAAAMVEQVSASAAPRMEMAQALQAIVAQFKLGLETIQTVKAAAKPSRSTGASIKSVGGNSHRQLDIANNSRQARLINLTK